MCEITAKWGPTEWAGIIQAIVALASAYLLYKTLKSQKESAKVTKEVAEIDKKAKRAEYLPVITGKILKPIYPMNNWFKDEDKIYDDEGFPVTFFEDIYGGKETKIIIQIFFEKNAVQIYGLDIEKNNKEIDFKSSIEPKNENEILIAGNFLEIAFSINMMKYFNVKPWKTSADLIERVSEDNDYRENFKLSGKIYFNDMIGNKYFIEFTIEQYDQLTLSNIKMID